MQDIDESRFDDILDVYNLRGPNFDDTYKRVNKMWRTFFLEKPPSLTSFPLSTKPGMIVLKGHTDWGFCPHHLLPVKYTFKIGYIPNKRVLGASKPLRIASYCLIPLPIQEDLGEMIANMITQAIDPKGVGVIITGEHSCMRIRGVKSNCVDMVTTYMTGVFLDNQPTREEFLLL